MRSDLVQALDVATKAQGLAIADKTLRLYQKLQKAPTVVQQTEPTPSAPAGDKSDAK